MKYVKNCPATYQNFEDKFVCTSQIKQKGFPFYCKDCSDCVIKRIAELTKVIDTPCDNCDGVGYFDGCKDTDCSFYRLMQIETLLEIEEVNE